MSKNRISQQEVIIQGAPASPGMAIGKAYVYSKKTPEIEDGVINERQVSVQVQLFVKAREDLKKKWADLLYKEQNEKSKAILNAQIAIIDDPDLTKKIEDHIRVDLYGAQRAINTAFNMYIDKLSMAGNTIMADRMIDIYDIRDQLLEAAGATNNSSSLKKGDILISEEISPREVVELSHQNIKGFVMQKGGSTSHAAIIARSVGIPAVVGAKGIIEKFGGDYTVCIDGERGLVAINPSQHTRKRVEALRVNHKRTFEEQREICNRTSETRDGIRFTLRANVEFIEELNRVLEFKAEGIGLLRTESVYLNREEFGSVENQAAFYGNILSQIKNHPVTIRLFDVGGDKFQGAKISESNPYLGWRGIRMLLDERELLRDQLKAVLMVAGQNPGQVRLLVPMVSRLDEIREVKKEIKNCQHALADAGHIVDESIPLGMMVEIPSAAVQAAHFAPEVDFFSVGTNDLTQYMLAVDRGNAFISGLYNQSHPAIWGLIDQIVKAAESNNIEVDVCGELAARPVDAACLLGMGVSSLSMSSICIPEVKRVLLQSSSKQMKNLAADVLRCTTTEEVETLFYKWKDSE